MAKEYTLLPRIVHVQYTLFKGKDSILFNAVISRVSNQTCSSNESINHILDEFRLASKITWYEALLKLNNAQYRLSILLI